jgi:hypothetical protein
MRTTRPFSSSVSALLLPFGLVGFFLAGALTGALLQVSVPFLDTVLLGGLALVIALQSLSFVEQGLRCRRDVSSAHAAAELPAKAESEFALKPMAFAPRPLEDEYLELLVLDEWQEMGAPARGWQMVHWLDAFDGRPAGWYGTNCTDLRNPQGWVLSTRELL